MFKLGITGCHGTGKTTKAIDLMEHYTFLGNKVHVVDEVARSCPYALGTIEAQEYIFHNQMARERYAMTQDVDVIICDRTVMDNLMYYLDIIENLFGAGNYTSELGRWDLLHSLAIRWMLTYSQVIRLPLNLEYLKADDPIRPKDVAYARRIDALFDRFVQPYVTDNAK